MALPKIPEDPAAIAERLLADPNADPAMVVALIGQLDALQNETLNTIEANAADRIGDGHRWLSGNSKLDKSERAYSSDD